jgi:hypothetical protein
MENKIPTAEEFVKQYQKGSDYFCITKGEAINKMIEFAKLYSIEFAKWLKHNDNVQTTTIHLQKKPVKVLDLVHWIVIWMI